VKEPANDKTEDRSVGMIQTEMQREERVTKAEESVKKTA
jgi:hypothetical protein